ncbi:hypothetical protein FRC17_008096 [Serendipita sp. 399]|nr:hypothetical protein FRC17_008096 [Serendipita sp. 399]
MGLGFGDIVHAAIPSIAPAFTISGWEVIIYSGIHIGNTPPPTGQQRWCYFIQNCADSACAVFDVRAGVPILALLPAHHVCEVPDSTHAVAMAHINGTFGPFIQLSTIKATKTISTHGKLLSGGAVVMTTLKQAGKGQAVVGITAIASVLSYILVELAAANKEFPWDQEGMRLIGRAGTVNNCDHDVFAHNYVQTGQFVGGVVCLKAVSMAGIVKGLSGAGIMSGLKALGAALWMPHVVGGLIVCAIVIAVCTGLALLAYWGWRRWRQRELKEWKYQTFVQDFQNKGYAQLSSYEF